MPIRHMALSLEGALRNFKGKSMKGLFTDDDGNSLSNQEARLYINTCINEGKRVIPMGDCPHFDFQNGCECHKFEGNEL